MGSTLETIRRNTIVEGDWNVKKRVDFYEFSIPDIGI